MVEASKENPSPLDAHETAKPNEPIWTVQGGDPLGPSLLQLWSWCARARAGAITSSLATGPDILVKLCDVIARNPAENKIEADALLVRATETEQVLWAMQAYQRGDLSEHQEEVRRFNEFDRLDIYDIRRRCAGLISSFFSELQGLREELIKYEWLEPTGELDNQMEGAVLALRSIKDKLDVGLKKQTFSTKFYGE